MCEPVSVASTGIGGLSVVIVMEDGKKIGKNGSNRTEIRIRRG